MGSLIGKKVILIALTEYAAGIIKELENLGANVVYIPDKPNNGLVCKALGRLKFEPYIRVIERYYHKKINEIPADSVDYILVIRGEYTPRKSLEELKRRFSTAPITLYMWDSLRNNKGIEEKWDCYDKVYTFDRIDYLNNEQSISFLPLFYYNSYVPNEQQVPVGYDIAFIGTGHEDRVRIIKGLKRQCDQCGLSMFDYVFLPHRLIYLRNKLLNKNYRDVSLKDIHFELMPTKEAYRIYSEAKCVVDIESPTQCGLTMRTIEMIGLRKKLITTNRDIVNYDFYNENNILVVDRKDFKIDPDFISRPYKPLDDHIYEKYSLHGWLLQVLGIERGDRI